MENELKDDNIVEEVVNSEEKVDVKPKKEKKEKKKTDEKENWFLKILKEEHKWETYLLGFLSCFAMGISALVLTNALVFNDKIPVLSDYQKQFGWIIGIVGIIGFILFIIPIFRPTKKELKHLSLPTKNLFLGNIVRVFLFITILASVFVLYESVISAILGFIIGKI